jgi:hypothetical protein
MELMRQQRRANKLLAVLKESSLRHGGENIFSGPLLISDNPFPMKLRETSISGTLALLGLVGHAELYKLFP